MIRKSACLLGLFATISVAAGCDGSAPAIAEQSSAALSTSSAELNLLELGNSCGSNQSQTFFKVNNSGSAPVTVADITIKYWVYNTSAPTLVPQVYTGGCLLDANGSCMHQVAGVTAKATKFSPACGSDASHQANWEITVSNTDPTALAAGLSWSNLQVALHLSDWSSFSPGTGTWYTACSTSSGYAFSAHAAIYAKGDLVTASTGVPPSCRAPRGSQQLSGEVPPAVATAPLVGSMPGSTQLALAIGLPLRNPSALATAIDAVSDPLSPQYRAYITSAQFAASYGPLQSDYDALVNFATANGLSVVQTSSSRNLIGVSGTVAAIEKALFVTLNLYRRADGTTFWAPANEPSLNLGPTVLHISGLDNYAPPHPANGGHGPTGCPPVFSAPAYVGSDFKKIYLSDASGTPCAATLDGTGQSVALVEFSDYYNQDITDYTNAYTLPAVSATRIVVAPASAPLLPSPLATSPTCGAVYPPIATSVGAGCGWRNSTVTTLTDYLHYKEAQSEGEVALDIEMVAAVAPKAQIFVYEQSQLNAVPASLLQKIADDGAQVISNSWTWGGSGGVPDTLLPGIFQQYAMQGQSFFQASGDLGAYIPGGAKPNVEEPTMLTSLMTVVGGTQLSTTGSGASLAYLSETTWNDPYEKPSTGVGNSVSGGGFCNSYGLYPTLPMPSYQAGLGRPFPPMTELSFPENTEVTTNPQNARMIPDVSIVADGLVIFSAYERDLSSTQYQVLDPIRLCSAGTSAGAPLWAAITALGNQANPTRPPIGFANPTLYYLASLGAFHDVADGSNNNYFGTAPSAYHATTAYDLATGLGSPNGCGVVKAIECFGVPTDGTPVSSRYTYSTSTTVRISVAGEVVWGGCDPISCPFAGACNFMRYGDANFHVDTCFNPLSPDPLMHAAEFNYPIQLYLDGAALPTGAFQPTHVYNYTVNGNGGNFTFFYNDIPGTYPDNVGTFSVCISTP